MNPRDLKRLRARLERIQPEPSPLRHRLQDLEHRQQRRALFQLPLSFGGQWLRRGILLYLRHEEPYPVPRVEALPVLTQGEVVRPLIPQETVFLDIETTGNGGAGVLPFLIGLGFWDRGTWVTEQFLLVDPGQEPLLLDWVSRRLRGYTTVVTYNGKAFDLPILLDRFRFHRLPPPDLPTHIDLLHMVRRVMASPSGYRLTEIERWFLGWIREADLPSQWVPRAYFQFLRGQGTTLLRLAVLHHREDIRVLPRLLAQLDRWVRKPLDRHSAADTYKIARLYFRMRDLDRAREFLEAGLSKAQGVTRHRLLKLKAMLHKRQKEWNHALHCWHELLREAPEDPEPAVELSKYYEHRIRDPYRALLYAWKLPQDREETRRRIQRLYRKIQKESPSGFPGLK